jgi:hypothetical protein
MVTHEAPVIWRKSSFSQNGDCVEVAYGRTQVLVRDSKDPHGQTLMVTHADWAAFIARAKSGYYTLADDH